MFGSRYLFGGLKITGDRKIDKVFVSLPNELQKKVLRPALRAAAKIVQAQAKANAPVRGTFDDEKFAKVLMKTGSLSKAQKRAFKKDDAGGTLRKSIVVRAGARSRKGIVRVNVTTGDESVNLVKGKAFYGAFIEFGHYAGKRTASVRNAQKKRGRIGASGGRTYVKPRPFMRPAFDSTKKQAREVAKKIIKEGVLREAAALAGSTK